MKAAEIIKQCHNELSGLPEADSITAAVLSWLSQEHSARQMLCLLPDVKGDPWLRQLNLLFANLYGESTHFCASANQLVSWQPLYQELPALGVAAPKSSRAINRDAYLAAMRKNALCLASLVPPRAQSAEEGQVSEEGELCVTDQTLPERIVENLPQPLRLAFTEFLVVLEQMGGVYNDANLKPFNLRAVRDWWFCLEDLPPLSKQLQQQLYDALLVAPIALRDEHLDRMEFIFLNPALPCLPVSQQANIIRELPLLLVESQASENLTWLLSENGFYKANHLPAHIRLLEHVDMLRCFMPTGVETLHALSECLAQFSAPEKSAFWNLLNLEALSRAAQLAAQQVGQSGAVSSSQPAKSARPQRSAVAVP